MFLALLILFISMAVALVSLPAAVVYWYRKSYDAFAAAALTFVIALVVITTSGSWDRALQADPLFLQAALITTLIFSPLILLRLVMQVPTPGAPSPRQTVAAPTPERRPARPEEPPRPQEPRRPAPPKIDQPLTTRQRLEVATQHLGELAQQSSAAFWVTDVADDRVLFVSPSFEKIWGRSAQEVYDDPARRWEWIHPDHRDQVRQSMTEISETGESYEEYRIERPDGSVRWISDQTIGIRDSQGEVFRLAGISEDISRRKGIEEINRFRANFVANMSHEVRTPLNIMCGYLELLLDGTFGEVPEEQEEVIQRVHKNAQELLELMSASLELSRLDNQTIPLSLEWVDVSKLMDDMMYDAEQLADTSKIEVRSRVAPSLPLIYSDEPKLKMVIKNLLANAIKYTEQGRVVLAAESSGPGIEISVSDTGSGIPAEALTHIFEPFRRGAEHHDSSTGVGLGLYIVRRLVDILEGAISVESTVGEGSKFRVWIPLTISSSAQRESTAVGA